MNKTYYSPNIGQLGVVPRISGLRSTFKIPRENSTIFEWAEENVTSTQENRSLIQNNKLKTNENSSPSAAQRSLQPQVHESAYSSDCDSEDNEFSDFVLVRNRSINEIHTNCGAVPKTSTSNNGDADNHGEKKLGHRRVAENGEVTYKKINSSHIMHSIQLGLSHAVGGLSEKPERDILMQDFKTTESTSFTFEGSKQMPDAHRFSDFRFESFAPIAFQYFRNLFCINPQDFLLSLCNQPLRELSNPGASGSIFYLSSDDEFIIKTVQHKEGEFLKKLLPGYNMNLNQNPRTLLPKFFGFYCYICNAKNVRMVVMNNLLPSSMKLHEKYDLKGSTCNRKASREERSKTVPTFKDLDFLEIHPEGISLEADTYNALIKTIERDCRVLESFKIMDYSLLLAIHNLDLAAKEEAKTLIQHSSIHFQNNGSRSINRRKLVAHSTTMESIQMNGETIGKLENYVPYDGIPARNAKGERLLVFLGIIDILQSYRLEKKLEHTLKSTIYDGDSISVHRPDFYSKRFRNFMAKQVFRKVSLSY